MVAWGGSALATVAAVMSQFTVLIFSLYVLFVGGVKRNFRLFDNIIQYNYMSSNCNYLNDYHCF